MNALHHALNSTLNGHLIVAWAMGLNAVWFFQRGGGLALIGILCGAVALVAGHIGSGIEAHGREGLDRAYVVAAFATALAWIFFILAVSI